MNYFECKYIDFLNHYLIGTTWPFRDCTVEMHSEGFSCTCKKNTKFKCNHIKSVEFGILGVNAKEYTL